VSDDATQPAPSSQSRQDLIKKIEDLRGSKVLVYVTGDRTPIPSNIGDDAVRPIVEHLRRLGRVDQLDLFIYSRGGAIDVPWRLNNALRSAAKRWSALVPFRANSAATLLCLGADEIVLGHHGELGPIDPIMNFGAPGQTGPIQHAISVEDVMAFPKFVGERFELTDPTSRVAALNRLLDRMDAPTLGSAYRTHSHIRYLAEKMLASRNKKLGEDAVKTIVATLAEKVYAHGHAVGFGEAKAIGLDVKEAPNDLEAAMWALLNAYERDLKLLDPLDPLLVTENVDTYTEEVTAAVIESFGLTHEHSGTLKVTVKRQMPQNLQVQLNAPIQLPPGVDAASLPQTLQVMLQQMQQAIGAVAQAAVMDAVRAQAPMVGFELRLQDGRWREVSRS
jgi:hypothetical protein